MINIYEFPGGAGWLIDTGPNTQIGISKGINKDKDGKDIDIQTLDDARKYFKTNAAFLISSKQVILGKAGKSEPTTQAGQV